MKDDLEKALDERLAQLLVEGEAVERSLAQPQLEPLLRLASEIEALPRPEPNPKALRATQVRVREAVVLIREKGQRRGLFFAWLTDPRISQAFARGLAVIVAMMVIGLGTVAASADSLPHSPLYPVKRTGERVQLFLTFSPSRKAHLHLFFAERRLNETMELMTCCHSVDDAVLMSMLEETDMAIEIICRLPAMEAEPLLDRAAELTANQHDCLRQVRGKIVTSEWCMLDEAISTCNCYEQILRGETPTMHMPTVESD